MSLMFAAIAKKKVFRGLISAGSGYSIVIDKNKRSLSWGSNFRGQLGDNSITNRYTPVSISGTVKTFCTINAGVDHSIAIDKNGRAWGWGYNGYGQLGDNSITNRYTPVSVVGAVKTFCKIGAGWNQTVAIDKNGRAWGWGYNAYGGLGDNSTIDRFTPVSVIGVVKTFCEISGGSFYSNAIDKNGRAWAWGSNSFGVLGDNTTFDRLTPVSIAGEVKTFCKINAGTYYHSLAIDKNGRAWAWGYNLYGQLGNGTTVSRRTPASVGGQVKTFCQISAGVNYSLALDKNGRAWGWGLNSSAQLGDNSKTNRLTPVSVHGSVKTFCSINAGDVQSIALEKNGRIWAWGTNTEGQLGNNQAGPTSVATPVSIAGATKTFCTIFTGVDYSIAIDKNGRAWGWGDNNGNIGDNTTAQRLTPVSVAGATKTFCEISTGNSHTMTIDKNGRAWGWGYNLYGGLGDNTNTSRSTPVSVAGTVRTFCKITAGAQFSMAIDKNGRAWGWGYNDIGQLGDNSYLHQFTPVSVVGAVKTFCSITSGQLHTIALDKNGRAWAWGYGFSGELGNNAATVVATPVSVLGAVKTFCQIEAGSQFSAAIDKNGRAWAWGYNAFGQLGDNTAVTSRRTPVSVAGAVKTFCKISVGFNHTLALDKNGKVWTWGFNNYGVLGDNTTVGRSTPVAIAGAIKTFCQINAGYRNSAAIDKNGRVWNWGLNTNGNLGNNVMISALTPVQVCNI